MADDQHRVAIGADIVLQPDHTFQIKIVGRLIKQQHVRFGKQRSSQRHTHAPAAGKRRAGLVLRCIIEAEPGQNGSGAGRRAVSINVCQSHLDVGNTVWFSCRFCFCQQVWLVPCRLPAPLRSGFQNRSALPAQRCRCGHCAAPCRFRILPVSGRGSVVSKVDLPVPLRPTKPTVWPAGRATVALSINRRPSTRYVSALI